MCDFPFMYAGIQTHAPGESWFGGAEGCTTAAPPPSGELLPVGKDVEAKPEGEGRWSKAKIIAAHNNDTYDLEFENDKKDGEKCVKREWIRYKIDVKEAWCMTETLPDRRGLQGVASTDDSAPATTTRKWGKCECG